MKTFGDLCKFISSAHLDMELFGASDEIRDDFRKRANKIGPTFCREKNLTSDEVLDLPAETELGEKTKSLAESLKLWFDLKTADVCKKPPK